MAESLLTGLVFTFFIVLVGRNFASGICKVNLKTYFLNLVFFAALVSSVWLRHLVKVRWCMGRHI